VIRVLVLGQPYWASCIASALDARDDIRATFVAQASYAKLLARPPRGERVVLVRVGYRVGASTARGRVFDAYWSALRRMIPGGLVCHYWLGTDVLETLGEAQAGTLRFAAVGATRDDLHLAVASWLAAELASIGLHAVTADVPYPYRSPDEPPPLPAEFRVVTYLPGDRFDFYGGGAIMEAAHRLPDVGFGVVGAIGSSPPPALPNVTWHGWVEDMTPHYAGASVVVRVPRHDGLGATVIEGLLHASHVIYTHDIPFVRTITPVTGDTLTQALGELWDAHRAGELAINMDGRSYALQEFDETRLTDNLAALLRKLA
jgi:hypothetical protein